MLFYSCGGFNTRRSSATLCVVCSAPGLFIPYKAVISQIGHGEYVDKLPFKLKAHIFLNDKIIHTYAAEHLKLAYRQDGDTKRGVASLNTIPHIPLSAICTPLKLQICIEWEKNEHIGKAFKFEIITSLSEI